ncbi:endonuclease domain-containing protein [Pectinatus brassicae]|uniref:Very-short-patch-repair endonuclease n=1 Tax=Pectinatus brassicae TaxID=862415 RepID=A0A840UWX6_9FIRM|nr:endonuclease domain-containing protein [Pectinatus brassicae]MBB5336895.1 very-short-patch-repair endonuclease [Pectinatus brassicae]MBB5336896.1 very-short-patch-repair endonuclease [Pectinatus brassicae]
MLYYNSHNNHLANNLRKNMTKEERHLWYDFLRNYPIKFYRQKQIGNYIADFYCHKAKLIIELDGSQHYEKDNQHADKKRSAYFNRYNLYVMRFSNLDIHQHFSEVCISIDEYIKNNNPSDGFAASSPTGEP